MLGLIRDREHTMTFDKANETSPLVEKNVIDSPFKGKDLMECHYILREIREEGSDINCMFFIVIDERAIKDHQAMIIAGYVEAAPDPDPELDEPEERMRWQREDYSIARRSIVSLSVPHGSWNEDK